MSEPTPAPADTPQVELLTQRYAEQIVGTLGCWDRVKITGTLTDVCHAGAVEGWLRRDHIRCFDLRVFAEPLRDAVRDHALFTARAAGLTIEHLERKNFRKEDRVAEVLQQRGDTLVLVHVFSAMEACQAFKPWHDKTTGQTGLRPITGRCLHYYFYFLHARLGLVYVRVPTWLPFRLQIYFNAHHWLARRLRRAGLKFQMADNALVECADWKKAQALADDFSLDQLKSDLDGLARQCVPALLERFRGGYHWSLMQVEYSLDLVWRSADQLAPVYEELSRQAIFTVKAPEVAKFLGKCLPANTDPALGSDFHTRIEGTRGKHFLGPASLKLYDKRGRVLRIEGTVNDVTFFSHHRKVEHRDGPPTYEVAPLKKSLFCLRDLRGLMHAACARYLAWLSRLEDRSSGQVDLDKLSRPAKDSAARSWRGFNLFLSADLQGILAVLAGEHHLSGLTSRRLQRLLPRWTRRQIGRLLRRLRLCCSWATSSSSCWKRGACCAPWSPHTGKPRSPSRGAARKNSPSVCWTPCGIPSCPPRRPSPRPAASVSCRTPPEPHGCRWSPRSSPLRPGSICPTQRLPPRLSPPQSFSASPCQPGTSLPQTRLFIASGRASCPLRERVCAIDWARVFGPPNLERLDRTRLPWQLR